jgi:hypothetical protein
MSEQSPLPTQPLNGTALNTIAMGLPEMRPDISARNADNSPSHDDTITFGFTKNGFYDFIDQGSQIK